MNSNLLKHALRQYEDFKSRQDAGAYLAHLDYLDHLCGELRSSLENLLAKARRLPRGLIEIDRLGRSPHPVAAFGGARPLPSGEVTA